MKDKDARKRIMILENRVARFENTIESLVIALQASLQKPLFNSICTKCNLPIYDGMICQNNDCPHGLDDEVM